MGTPAHATQAECARVAPIRHPHGRSDARAARAGPFPNGPPALLG